MFSYSLCSLRGKRSRFSGSRFSRLRRLWSIRAAMCFVLNRVLDSSLVSRPSLYLSAGCGLYCSLVNLFHTVQEWVGTLVLCLRPVYFIQLLVYSSLKVFRGHLEVVPHFLCLLFLFCLFVLRIWSRRWDFIDVFVFAHDELCLSLALRMLGSCLLFRYHDGWLHRHHFFYLLAFVVVSEDKFCLFRPVLLVIRFRRSKV